uniref:Uncharacterized protein n=1 Tax=Ditylenchus dipsaci TaxID=166011 RepID=A0A915E429_9BILA
MCSLESDNKSSIEKLDGEHIREFKHSFYTETDFLRSYHVVSSLSHAGYSVQEAEEIVSAMRLLIKHKIAIPTTKITGELLPKSVISCHDFMKKVSIEQDRLNSMFDSNSLVRELSTGADYIEVEVHDLLIGNTSFLTTLYGKEFNCMIEDTGRKSLEGKRIFKITGEGDQVQKTKRLLLISIQRLLAAKKLQKIEK